MCSARQMIPQYYSNLTKVYHELSAWKGMMKSRVCIILRTAHPSAVHRFVGDFNTQMRRFASDFKVPIFDWDIAVRDFQYPQFEGMPLPDGIGYGTQGLPLEDPHSGWGFMADNICHQRDCVSEHVMQQLYDFADEVCS